MTDLKDHLTGISGVGDATADKILEVLDEHGSNNERIRDAFEHLEAGHVEQATEILHMELNE